MFLFLHQSKLPKTGHNDVIEFMLEFNPKRADRLLGINDIDSKCVLHMAIAEDCLSTLEMLLNGRGKKLINDTDKDYKSCLHYTAEKPTNDVSGNYFCH